METNIVKKPQATVSREIGGKTLTIETGKLAKLAQGAITIRMGDTMILVTAGISDKPKDLNFLPLTVEYQERFYATGKILGNRFQRREGRPSTRAVLTSRVIDRPIRPMFPKTFRNDVQILLTVLSCDMEEHPANMAITGASAALMLTGAPFDGPVAGVRIGRVDGQLIVNPTYAQLDEGDLDLMVAGTMDSITMVEAGADEVDPETMIKALELAHGVIKEQCELQIELVKQCNPTPMEIELPEMPADLKEEVMAAVTDADIDAMYGLDKYGVHHVVEDIETRMLEKFADKIADEESAWTESYVKEAVNKRMKERMRQRILDEGKRLDNRSPQDVRQISSEVGLIPRAHGSGLFTRGDTQILSIATIGAPGDVMKIEDMDKEAEQRYMHHYNFPPYSTGEAYPIRFTSRREVGHGNLAERGLMPMIPAKEDFPYTVRVVSETVACNGSSSMGSVCGSTLSLMDAGVPLKRPVAGIAMGLIMDDDTGKYVVLSDIIAQEDFLGDMDFKYIATEKGITALQMDLKIKGLPVELLRNAIKQAEEGRQYIMKTMMEAISAPRAELSQYAPRIITLKIDPDKIRLVIGPGGKMINKITEETGVSIDIEDTGLIMVTTSDAEGGARAKKMIEDITYEPKAGDEFEGEVKKVMEFGAFVEILPGKEGLVHISKLAPHRVENVRDVVNEGDIIKVKLEEIDKMGRLNLTHKPYFQEKK